MIKTVTFTYLNHRGITAERTINFEALEFIRDPGFGYQSGWFISGHCHDKKERRSFALNRIVMSEISVPKVFTLMKL
ncbi:hypothetical protein [Mesorhizobium sp. CN2-181]|uniref:hypothetical protein n=1 Tax=Mesorhizobium yinganensis TaxID=3157707 RepID=UPI0032B874D2